MKQYFKTKEFLISPQQREGLEPVPLHVIDKLWTVHIPILNDMRFNICRPIYVSQNSGYRSKQWEIEHGRSGDGEHTFEGLGAVDITADEFEALCELAIRSEYKRVAIYHDEKFIHCDMKGMKRVLFNGSQNGWEFVRNR